MTIENSTDANRNDETKKPNASRKPQRRRSTSHRNTQKQWTPEQFVVPEVEGKKRFHDFNLPDEVLHAVADLNFEYCTGIQAETIPAALAGKDIIGKAQTGTGKTAAFAIPIIHKISQTETNKIKCLILAPTRELAVQIGEDISEYGKYTNVKTGAMFGGITPKRHIKVLKREPNILVSTIGRLQYMIEHDALHFDELEMLVLDEADRMLDMGFIDDINKIIERLPKQRQNLLFSATISSDVRALAKRAIHNPAEISIAQNSTSKPNIDQWLITIDKGNKSALLSHLIKEHQWQQALIFIETKHGAAKLVSQLEKRNISAEAIHSGRTQAIREQILNDFKSGEIKFLVATGIAARGLDIGELARVVNYDLPDQVDDYIHRIGRTGRAGASGEAISFVSKDNFRNLCAIESRLGHVIVRKEVEGFPVKKVVPI